MRRYNFLQAIYMSFYSRDLYRDVADNWGGGVILYLLLVLLIAWISTLWNIQTVIHSQADRFITKVAPQLPGTITIQKGAITTPENRPYIIKDPEDQHIIAIIDTSGKYTQLPQEGARILITKQSFAHTENDKTVAISPIPMNFNLTITKEQTELAVLKLLDWLWVLIFPFVLLFSWMYRLLQSLLYAVIGSLIAAMSGQHLAYATVLKLTIVSLTPTILIGAALEWIHIIFPAYGVVPFMGLIFFIVSMVYLVFAIHANR